MPQNTSIISSPTTKQAIWQEWSKGYTSTSTSSSTILYSRQSSTHVWTNWNNAYYPTTTPTISTTYSTWRAWNASYIPLTPAQTAEYNARLAPQRERALQIEGERAKARERAQVLLQEHLSDQQKAMLAANDYFELDLIEGEEVKRYRIHRKWSGNIQQIDPSTGRKLKTLCIHPREQTPVEDSMLAQKFMLEGGMERELLRIANHS